MTKKWIIALLSLSLFAPAYFADTTADDSSKEESKSDADKKADNKGQLRSAEVNKGKQGEKMRQEHANKKSQDRKSHGADKGHNAPSRR